jgi:hypothetical protein
MNNVQDSSKCTPCKIPIVLASPAYVPFFVSFVNTTLSGYYLCLQILTNLFAFYAHFTTPCLWYHFNSFLYFDLFIWSFHGYYFIGIVCQKGYVIEVKILEDRSCYAVRSSVRRMM